MNYPVLILVLAALAGTRFFKPNLLLWLCTLWLALLALLKFAVAPPLPSSIVSMFMAIITIALAVYATADTKNFGSLKLSLVTFLTDAKCKLPLTVIVIAIPCLAGYNVYTSGLRPATPPTLARTIHPAPPEGISFKGKKINLITADNPYRALETSAPDEFAEHVANGRRVYYQNCVFCHGDNMQGDGIYAHGLNPIPANFADPTTIAMLQESFLFWRIAKGGPGLPEESAPWDSAMPAWELFLSEKEIWDVILFLYDFNDQKPRAREHHE